MGIHDNFTALSAQTIAISNEDPDIREKLQKLGFRKDMTPAEEAKLKTSLHALVDETTKTAALFGMMAGIPDDHYVPDIGESLKRMPPEGAETLRRILNADAFLTQPPYKYLSKTHH